VSDVPKQFVQKQKYKPIWMTHKVSKLLRKKHGTYAKYKSANHPAYRKVSKAAKSELRKARRNFESMLAQNVKNDNKSFFAYSRSKTRLKTTLGPLLNQSGELLKDPHELSQEFNNFFELAFTDEDLSEVPRATNMSSLVSDIIQD